MANPFPKPTRQELIDCLREQTDDYIIFNYTTFELGFKINTLSLDDLEILQLLRAEIKRREIILSS